MAKFVRQSVYGWQQYRNDIKKKKHMFEGKEYLGWDLPMHEQIRLYRMAEARIVEVANFTNFSDQNPTATATSAGKVLRKIAKAGSFESAKFAFTTGITAGFTGSSSGSAATSLGSSSIGSNLYIDLYAGNARREGLSTGPHIRLSFETSSTHITASLGGADYRLTCSLDLLAEQSGATAARSTRSLLLSCSDAINNDLLLAPSVQGARATASTFYANAWFSASVSQSSDIYTLYLSCSDAGTTHAPMSTNIASATASVTLQSTGKDLLCGPDGVKWSNSELKRTDYTSTLRVKGTHQDKRIGG